MKPFVIFLFGPPGSGKSTQAALIAKEFGAVHVDTGDLLRVILDDPARQHDPKIQEERVKNETQGRLNDSVWVAGIVIEEVKKLYAAGKSMVFSGSPRTIFEAQVEIPVFKELYPKRTFVVVLHIEEETTFFRNSHRRVCLSCSRLFVWSEETKNLALCPTCGTALTTRPDDRPEIIKRRVDVYEKRTMPLITFFQSEGLTSFNINGEVGGPEKVFAAIKEELRKVL